jgi:hypothetical protein
MSSKSYPTDVLDQAGVALAAWQKIEAVPALGELTPTSFAGHLAQAQAIQVNLDALAAQLTDLRNQRDKTLATVWDDVKRVRAGMKAIYGDDSSQYEMVGGTRKSERKKPTRPAATA